ncbi:MAG: hypothetical protein ACFFFG_15900 [Candidatus Thorarchaeota archaeon]
MALELKIIITGGFETQPLGGLETSLANHSRFILLFGDFKVIGRISKYKSSIILEISSGIVGLSLLIRRGRVPFRIARV